MSELPVPRAGTPAKPKPPISPSNPAEHDIKA
jgi:hypothetical protein